jgi:hypothetical protein
LIVWIAEAEGDAADVFDDPVVALTARVGQAGGDREKHWLLPCFDGLSEVVDFGDFFGE